MNWKSVIGEKPKRGHSRKYSILYAARAGIGWVLGLLMIVFCAVITFSNIEDSFRTSFYGIHFDVSPDEIQVETIIDSEAHDFLLNEFDLELSQDANEIHVWTNDADDRIFLRAKASFIASSENTELWLNSIYACTLSNSFEKSFLRPLDFQWDNAPNWWQPEEASNVILGRGCLPSNRYPNLHNILVNTDDDEIWTTYIVISFP